MVAHDDDLDLDVGERSAYSVALGERLRGIRQQQGLSLHDVERRSGGGIKASVLGAYERGERALSVPRLRLLADFYRVPITEFLPSPEANDARRAAAQGLCIDLTRLESVKMNGVEVIERFLWTIQSQRRDYNGRVLTIRGSDLRPLAAVLDLSVEELTARLMASGIAAPRVEQVPSA